MPNVSGYDTNQDLTIDLAMIAVPPGPANPPNWQAVWNDATGNQLGSYNGFGLGDSLTIPAADLAQIDDLTVQFVGNSAVATGDQIQITMNQPTVVICNPGMVGCTNVWAHDLANGSQVFFQF